MSHHTSRVKTFAYFTNQRGRCRDVTEESQQQFPEFLMVDGQRYRLGSILRYPLINEIHLFYSPAPAEDYGA